MRRLILMETSLEGIVEATRPLPYNMARMRLRNWALARIRVAVANEARGEADASGDIFPGLDAGW